MFYSASIEQVKKVVVIGSLLMFSALLQAESSDNAATSESGLKTETENRAAADDHSRDFKFPDWPKRQQLNRDMVPPPPPGPYMSSALSDFSVRGPSFTHNLERQELIQPVPRLSSATIPMETFSPDRPWPDFSYRKHKHSSNCSSGCAPQRWMPESGYHYVKPPVQKQSYSVVQNRMPGQAIAPRGRAWSNSRLPPMGNATEAVYPHVPQYGSRYNGRPMD